MHKTVKRNLEELGIVGKTHRYAVKGESTPISLSKYISDTSLNINSAVSEGVTDNAELTIKLSIPRRAGLCGVKLVICEDGGENRSFDLELLSDSLTEDTFGLSLKTSFLPKKLAEGLYYYHLELSFGCLTLYTDVANNVDFFLSENYPQGRFRLLVFQNGFDTPDWFKGNIMYHVFVDRFCKGRTPVPVSPTAVINPDWDGGIPQYGEYPGAFVENNVFFGGTLYGITEKLDYLEGLGVGCIYLSPIFKAYSNHKYDTGDYMTVDEMFGGDGALEELIDKANKRGIRIVLDGVFNHTGDDSLYFNRYNRYNSLGAYGNPDSPYRDWYCFEPDGSYKSWWGVKILPKLNLLNRKCEDYFLGSRGVLEKYLGMGIGGIRLDVADELPQGFLERLRKTVRKSTPDGLIIGEVWENASDKIAYGERRRYFRGGQLDSVMNYPQKNAVIELVKNGDTEFFYNTITELYSSYPKQCSDVLMNILGTHDTDRILTVLCGDSPDGLSNDELSVKRMTKAQRGRAIRLLKVASAVQYTLFGTPSVFYGDEAGLEGYHDPFCRLPYPWGREESELLDHYRSLGRIRRSEPLFKDGKFEFVKVEKELVAYRRYDGEEEILVVVNVSKKAKTIDVTEKYVNLLTAEETSKAVKLLPMSVSILKKLL